MSDLTPMMKQYQAIKEQHRDAILLYRLGDFYEMFADDALLASRELEITLTGRGHEDKRVPMCGVPFHAAESYVAKLIKKGYKVAICEQTEDPAVAKGIVKREVTRVITPGTLLEANLLDEKKNNYLAAICVDLKGYGISCVDSSTGEFITTQIIGDKAKAKLEDELLRINPSEVLVPQGLQDFDINLWDFFESNNIFVTEYFPASSLQAAQGNLCRHFKVQTLDGFGISESPLAIKSAVAILDYLKQTQKVALDHITKISPYYLDKTMILDQVSLMNLEICETLYDKQTKGSLLGILDQTSTSMGARLLQQWLKRPLINKVQIEDRQEAVAQLVEENIKRTELIKVLRNIQDISRITSRIAAQKCNPRDLIALKMSLKAIPIIYTTISSFSARIFKEFLTIDPLTDLVSLIERAIIDEPPIAIKEGGIIKEDFTPDLAEIREAMQNGKQWLRDLEAAERERTGIKNLKVSFNKVFGYFIEITKSNLANVPDNYIRKQTLVNNERFITAELKEKESLILNAESRVNDLEYKIFCQVREQMTSYTEKLQALSEKIAELDVITSFAEVAVDNKYCCPQIKELGEDIIIEEGRHPTIEKLTPTLSFVPNDTFLEAESKMLIITGPNMAGKSTYMRQIALILVMAQIGSFVPAKSAQIGIVDRIFSRIGARDDLSTGRSTFMVEMTETANILNNATKNSLIILDEIGRGTSTFDGMSIAYAVAEYIHLNIKAKTLFATHYHELTRLVDLYPGMKNLNTLIKEDGENLSFLYKIVRGPADKSYGIQVARLAGLPETVVQRSHEVYQELEQVENNLKDEEIKNRFQQNLLPQEIQQKMKNSPCNIDEVDIKLDKFVEDKTEIIEEQQIKLFK